MMSRYLTYFAILCGLVALGPSVAYSASGTVPGPAPFDTIVNAVGQASSGDVITVNNGVYVEGSQIAIPDEVELVAANDGAATIVGVGDPMIAMGNSSRIAGFILDGTNNFAGNNDALSFSGITDAVAEDLVIINQPLAILFNNSATGIVRRTVIQDSGLLDKPAIRLNSGPHQVVLEDVEIRNHLGTDAVIRVFPGANESQLTCTRLQLNDSLDFAFLVESDTSTVTFNNCEFIGNGWLPGQVASTSALWIRGRNDTVNLNNTVIANSGVSGIRQDAGVLNSVHLDHCVIYGNSANGIVISDSPNSSVTNTIFSENGDLGIGVRDSDPPAAFSHCLTFNNSNGDFEAAWIPDGTFILVQDPSFAGANIPPRADPEGAAGDYTVQSGSPALGAGIGGLNIGLEEGPPLSVANWEIY